MCVVNEYKVERMNVIELDPQEIEKVSQDPLVLKPMSN